MSQFYAYIHLRPDGIPFYVGKGSGERAYNLLSGRSNKHHRNIVLKHGSENIIVEMMHCTSEAEAFLREELAISALRAAGVKLCNLTDGGEGTSGIVRSPEARANSSVARIGKRATAETRAKMSATRKGRVSNRKGAVMSEEQRKKMSQIMTGYKYSDEAKKMMSLSHIGNQNSKGVKHTKERNDKIANALRGRKLSEETRKRMSESAKARCERQKSITAVKG